MSTAIVPAGLIPQSVAETEKIADKFAKATIAPDAFKGKPADAFMAVCYGAELGIAPATALSSIAVIKGKPTLYAATMHALVMGSGKAKYFSCTKSSPTSATYETQRVGSPHVQSKTFTVDDAKAAGLLGGMYSKYPQRMLEARAKSALARDVYPDVLHGLQSYEEVSDEPSDTYAADVSGYTEPEVVDAEIVEEEPLMDRLFNCKTEAEISALLPELGKLKGDERAKALDLHETMIASVRDRE